MNKVFIITFSYLLNGFFPTILMFLFFFLGNPLAAADIAYISSFLVILFQIFSSNKRNLILSKLSRNLIYETYLFRLLFLIPTFIFYLLFLYLNNILIINNLILFFLFSYLWINEIFISSNELKRNNKPLKYFIFLIIVLIFSLAFNEFFDLNSFVSIILLFILFLILPNINLIFKKKKLINFVEFK